MHIRTHTYHDVTRQYSSELSKYLDECIRQSLSLGGTEPLLVSKRHIAEHRIQKGVVYCHKLRVIRVVYDSDADNSCKSRATESRGMIWISIIASNNMISVELNLRG